MQFIVVTYGYNYIVITCGYNHVVIIYSHFMVTLAMLKLVSFFQTFFKIIIVSIFSTSSNNFFQNGIKMTTFEKKRIKKDNIENSFRFIMKLKKIIFL